MSRKIRCTLTVEYDEDDLVKDWEKSSLPENILFRRARLRMLEDMTDFDNPLDIGKVECNYEEYN
jgi:hypothetical protein